MYSNNDFRLYHSDKKWSWPNGNNSKEYNHWYYKNHPEKWTKGAKNLIDVLKADEDLYQAQMENKRLKKEYRSARNEYITVSSTKSRKKVKAAKLSKADKKLKSASDNLTRSNETVKKNRKIVKDLESRYRNTIIGTLTEVAEKIGRKVLKQIRNWGK